MIATRLLLLLSSCARVEPKFFFVASFCCPFFCAVMCCPEESNFRRTEANERTTSHFFRPRGVNRIFVGRVASGK
uniref:Putative secreted protein n=1 Tax=Anopheles marajoara TaxID=58244 RepID=A0A2M4CDL1_9DIPT